MWIASSYGKEKRMLHLSSWTETLPMMVSGMLGIILVMGVIVLVVMALNKLTSRK